MTFQAQLLTLKDKSVTVFILGSAEQYAGTLLEIGDDYIRVDSGPDDAVHKTRSMIPLAAISCVVTRS